MVITDWGFDPLKMACGFCGGVVYAFWDKQTHPFIIAGSLVTGTFMANFLGDAANSIVGNYVGKGGSYFVAGLCGMVIVPAILSAAKKWTSSWSPGKDGVKPDGG